MTVKQLRTALKGIRGDALVCLEDTRLIESVQLVLDSDGDVRLWPANTEVPSRVLYSDEDENE